MIIWLYLGVPKTMLSFDYSLEGLIELKQAIMVTVYFSKRVQTKISNRKRHKGSILETSDTRFRLSSLSGVMQAELNPPSSDVWQHIWSIANQKLTRALVSRDFVGGWSYRYIWLFTQLILVSRPSTGQADTMRPKAPSINHLVGMHYLAGPRPPGKKGHLSGETFKELRGYLRRGGQQPNSSS